MTVAVIGGSGLAAWPELSAATACAGQTPYGAASAAPLRASLDGRPVLFLPRHGASHALAPHRINYRANLFALRAAGARCVVAVCTVGAIHADLAAGDLVLPDQLLDYTWGRESTYYDGVDGPLRHVEFTEPFEARVRGGLRAGAAAIGAALAEPATYAATQGPRLETAAEITRLERDGADVVGMTAMPEAALARELDLPYAALAVVANRAAGRGALGIFEEIAAHQARGIAAALAVVRAALPALASL
jgi:5'-methylthioinosine phosphorylase